MDAIGRVLESLVEELFLIPCFLPGLGNGHSSGHASPCSPYAHGDTETQGRLNLVKDDTWFLLPFGESQRGGLSKAAGGKEGSQGWSQDALSFRHSPNTHSSLQSLCRVRGTHKGPSPESLVGETMTTKCGPASEKGRPLTQPLGG